MVSELIYFDNAATTFPKPEEVYRQMDYANRNLSVNAGRGSYGLAMQASKLIEGTRKNLAELINLDVYNNVVLTPSATIALNQIIFGSTWDEYKNVYVTPFEHNAIIRPLKYLEKKYNIKIFVIPFDNETFELNIDKLKYDFSRNAPDYIFTTHISNVTGYIIPVEDIAEIARQYNPIITVDCSQSMGLLPIDCLKTSADYLVFAGHKSLYGPFGIGGFIDVRGKMELSEVILGGTGSDSLNPDMPNSLPHKYESASYNIQAISGLNAALNWIKSESVQEIYEKENILTAKVIDGLNQISGIRVYKPSDIKKITSIVSFNLHDLNANDVGLILDQDFNIAVRSGYHCAPLVHDFLNTRRTGGTVRISVGYFNNEKQIEYLLHSLRNI
jgi:cysteine desulfurase family protein